MLQQIARKVHEFGKVMARERMLNEKEELREEGGGERRRMI